MADDSAISPARARNGHTVHAVTPRRELDQRRERIPTERPIVWKEMPTMVSAIALTAIAVILYGFLRAFKAGVNEIIKALESIDTRLDCGGS